MHILPLVFSACRSDLPSVLGSPHVHCRHMWGFALGHRRVCRLCHTVALGDERHMPLECPARADRMDKSSPLAADCSGVMAGLVWDINQPMVSRYIIACLDRMLC